MRSRTGRGAGSYPQLRRRVRGQVVGLQRGVREWAILIAALGVLASVLGFGKRAGDGHSAAASKARQAA